MNFERESYQSVINLVKMCFEMKVLNKSFHLKSFDLK